MSPKKRASAFDDFPEPGVGPAAGEQPPAPVPARPAPGAAVRPAPGPVERIERLKPSQMLPDRFQPRRLLPTALRGAFFSGQTDCYQAAAAWLELARSDAGYQNEIDRLLAMGDSFDAHGQIQPITGSWVPASDGRYLFVIETGERRFWAACLRSVREHRRDEPLLRVEVVEKPTRQRQVLENRHSEPPSAVGQACEVAALVLAELGHAPDPALPDDFDYFRQARSQRMPAGLWERLTPVMQLTRPRMVQLLNILSLPTPLLELADRYRLPDRVLLAEVLGLPPAEWEGVLRYSIQNQLTSDEVAELARPAPRAAPAPAAPAAFDPGRSAAGGLRRFANALLALEPQRRPGAIDEAADILIASGQAAVVVELLQELQRMVQARLDRMQG